MRHGRRMIRQLLFSGILLAALAALAGCGGGGGSSSSGDTVSGTAAAGAPISGIIYLRDAAGTIVTSDIGTDGAFSLDVGSLTAPFVIWTDGSAGGRFVRLYSYAAARGSKANVTPVTNMALALALGQNPAVYFTGHTAPPSGFDTELNQAVSDLNFMLADALADGFDVMTSSFTPDGSGFDGVMDVLGFEVDESDSGVLEIKIVNKVSGSEVFEVEVDTATGVKTTVTDDSAGIGTIISQNLGIRDQLRAVFDAMAAEWASGTPSSLPASITDHFAPELLDEGMDKATMITSWTTGGEGPPPGFEVTSFAIYRPMMTYYKDTGAELAYECPDCPPAVGATYTEGVWVLLTIGGTDPSTGATLSENVLESFVKDASGNWYLYGNRIPFENGGGIGARHSMEVRQDYENNSSAVVTRYNSGMECWMQDNSVATGVSRVLIIGDGLVPDFRSNGTYNSNAFTGTGFGVYRTGMTAGDATSSGLALDLDGGTGQYAIVNVDFLNEWNNWMYSESDTPALAASDMDDPEYVFIAIANDADPTANHAWCDMVPGAPIPASSLTSSSFPNITSHTDHNYTTLQNDAADGSVTLSWNPPAGTSPEWCSVSFWSDTGGGSWFDADLWDQPSTTTSTTITGVSEPGGSTGGSVEVGVRDSGYRSFTTRWEFWQ